VAVGKISEGPFVGREVQGVLPDRASIPGTCNKHLIRRDKFPEIGYLSASRIDRIYSFGMVEMRGFEPLASALRRLRSPN
jgi:hypothetical protein